MNNTIEYKGYEGSVEYSEADCVFYGKVLGVHALISYEGKNTEELIEDFQRSIDEYIAFCKAMGEKFIQ